MAEAADRRLTAVARDGAEEARVLADGANALVVVVAGSRVDDVHVVLGRREHLTNVPNALRVEPRAQHEILADESVQFVPERGAAVDVELVDVPIQFK